VVVSLYFIIFFRNMFHDALDGGSGLPVAFSWLFTIWMGIEYYFGSPFFQSGIVEPSQLWKGVFAFFFYPFLGYCAADYTWTHTTQLAFLSPYINIVGIAGFVLGAYLRLDSLRTALRVPGGKLLRSGLFRKVRHPRYLATLVQMLAIPLVFSSWLGLLLALAIGLPLIWAEIRSEEARLESTFKADFAVYQRSVPILIPRARRKQRL
jgi:protein-S-isoprenylcysteine O-methyltransferase Ste14